MGHWEIDCVVSGYGSKTVLLVLTHRSSRKALIYIMRGKMQANVAEVLNKLDKKYKNRFKKIFKNSKNG